MISFKELNENVNEYNLIIKIIEYSGKQNTVYDEYERRLKKHNYKTFKKEMYNNLQIEVIREFKDTISWWRLTESLNTLNYLNKSNIMDFIKEFKCYIQFFFFEKNIEIFNLNKIEFIREFKDRLNWWYLTNNLKKLKMNTIDFIREFKDKIKWYYISNNLEKYNLNSIELIKEFEDKLNFNEILNTLKCNLKKIEFVKNFQDKLQLRLIIKSKEDYDKYKDILKLKYKIYYRNKYSSCYTLNGLDIPDEKKKLYNEYNSLLKKYNYDIFNKELYNNKLSVEIIREFSKCLYWYQITKNLKEFNLNTIEFIREFKNEVYWLYLTYNLIYLNFNTIEFIREFKNKVDWYDISNELNELNFNTIEFIREFKDKLNWKIISVKIKEYNFDTIEFIREFKDRLCWGQKHLKIIEELNLNTKELVKELQRYLYDIIINSKENYEKYKDILKLEYKIYYKK
jgi:hypothetical protein